MKRSTIWLLGLTALALLFFFCIRHHLGEFSQAAKPAAAVVANHALRADKLDGKVTLRGKVKDEASRQTLVKAAQTRFGETNVTDELTLDASAHALPAGVTDWFPPLWQPLKTAVVELDGQTLRLHGTVTDAALKTQLGAEAEKTVAGWGAGWRVDNQIKVITPEPVVAAPAAAPAAPSACPAFDAVVARNTIQFRTGSARLTDEAVTDLKTLGSLFKECGGKAIAVVGHTDNVGGNASNLALSKARAASVRSALMASGIDGAQISTDGKGEAEPIADNTSADGRQQNRRIQFTVSK